MDMSITYRLAGPEDWPQIEPVWRECFLEGALPTPEAAQIAIAEDNGRIVGFLLAQTYLSIDQIGVTEEYRGNKVSVGKLTAILEDEVARPMGAPGYITFTTVPRDRKMGELGYTLPPCFVYRKYL